MHRSSFSNSKTTARAVVAAAFSVLVFLSLTSPAAADSDCAKWADRLLDTSDNCVSEPFRNRASGVETFTWKGHDYVIFNGGNELFIYNIDDPANPLFVDESRFRFGTVGDQDYALLKFDVCDDCRYAIFAHDVKRTVVVDLGTKAIPDFGLYATYQASDTQMGGAVFNKGGQNFLFAGGLEGGCAASGLYLVNGVDNLELIPPCVEVGGSPLTVRALHTYDAPAGFFLYTGVNRGVVHIFRAEGSGLGLSLDYRSSPVGMFGQRSQLSVDENNGRAASVDSAAGVIRIWDLEDDPIHGYGPGNPREAFTIPAQVATLSLRSPSPNTSSTLVAVNDGWRFTTRTFEVGATSAREFNADFWSDPSLPHNNVPGCVYPLDLALSPDGSVDFLGRFATLDVFDLSECLAPTPAIADLSITPSPVFPGQSIEVRDTSSGRIDEWALWVTEGASGPVVAGNDVLNTSNPRTINYTVPQNLAAGVSYVAHVEVDSSELIPDRSYWNKTVGIDRTPQASFTISPSAVIVGDSVTLTASAEGIIGSGGYQWLITDPSGSTVSTTGQIVTHTVNAAGNWDFELNVGYDHQDPGSPPSLYTATYSVLDYAVSSVAADFLWTPLNPLHTQQITLDGSTSKPTGGGLSYQWDVASANHTYAGCPAQVQCVIPPEALDPDTSYSVVLTVWNGPDSSVRTKYLFVGNGNVQPAITWSPTSPEKGETVLFSIEGVPADIDKASWNMGGGGCDGADSTPVCTPSLWNKCKTQAYEYSSSGTKTVTVSVVVGENTFTAPPVTVSVQSSGSCDPTGPPPSCEYTLLPSSFNFGPAASNTKFFSVNTGSSCSWVATATAPWIKNISPKFQATGSGTVSFNVDANTGPQRTGFIHVGTATLIVNQQAPNVPANFTMSNSQPEIGETVTFAVDPILEVVTWDFGEKNCDLGDPFIDCRHLPAGTCNIMQWTFSTSGTKSVTMVLSDGRTQTKLPMVQPRGECCFAEGKPDASFVMSADEIYTGQTVIFTDTSAKLTTVSAKALGFTSMPENPEIGETVIFTLDGVVDDIEKTTWNFGETGCDDEPALQECIPSLWDNCQAMSFAFASAGLKPVSVDVEIGGGTETVGPNTVDVANAGSCDGGGGGCSYTLSDSTASFPFEGGTGSFTVTTTAECAWTATTTSSFIEITSASGTGSGTVDYVVSASVAAASRSGIIRVEGRIHRVTQEGDRGDTAPTAWWWTITRTEDGDGEPVNEDVMTSTDPNTSFTFTEPGYYRVRLTASNCFGDDFRIDFVEVLEAPVEDFVVGAAVSLDGAHDTRWESDLRFYNPCGEDLDVRIEYQPENTDNTGADLVFREFGLGPNETRIFADITEAIPGLGGDEITGSVRIESQSDSGCKVLSVSRTFNDTPEGSLGLFVPALPVKRVGREFLDLTGLIQSEDYRTNLRLVSYGDQEAWIPITAYDKGGHQVGDTRSAMVRGHSTKQLNEIAVWLGLESGPAPFSVRVNVDGHDVEVFATVVDNLTGDSVLYLSSFHEENVIWLAGVASLEGINESQWRTDLWLYNPTEDWLGGEIEFVVGDDPSNSYGFEWPTLGAHRTKQYLDIVSDKLGLEETRGYIVLTGADGGPAPQVAARTYNLDASTGGTYGLNLRAFASDDLLVPGETGFIAGVSNSENQTAGFRTNMGFLNTDRDRWTAVRITMYDVYGVEAADPYEFQIAPGKLRQFDIFKKLGLGGVTMTGSIRVEVTEGGGVAVYATEIDNRTQDSIFVPAQRMFQGLAPQ